MKIVLLQLLQGIDTIAIGEGDNKSVVTVLSSARGVVKLGIDAPKHIKVSNALSKEISEREANNGDIQ